MDSQTQNVLGLNLGVARSFAEEKALALTRVFQFSVSNKTGQNQVVILNPSFMPSDARRVIRDGFINYNGANPETLKCESLVTGRTIQNWLDYVKEVPTRCLITQIDSTDASQLAQSLVVITKDMFEEHKKETITISAYKSPTFTNDKLINVERPFSLDFETEVSIIVPGKPGPGEENIEIVTTFTFYCGAYINQAEQLYNLAVGSSAKG